MLSTTLWRRLSRCRLNAEKHRFGRVLPFKRENPSLKLSQLSGNLALYPLARGNFEGWQTSIGQGVWLLRGGKPRPTSDRQCELAIQQLELISGISSKYNDLVAHVLYFFVGHFRKQLYYPFDPRIPTTRSRRSGLANRQ
jgi:hypothetical protein